MDQTNDKMLTDEEQRFLDEVRYGYTPSLRVEDRRRAYEERKAASGR